MSERRPITRAELLRLYPSAPYLGEMAWRLYESRARRDDGVLGVITQIYDSSEQTVSQMLDSVFRSISPFRFIRIYVVDNTDTETSWPRGSVAGFVRQYSGSLGPKHKIVLLGGNGNLGFRAGHNVALEKAMEDGCGWILIMNDDGVIHPATIEVLLSVLKASQQAVVASPAVYFGSACPPEPLQASRMARSIMIEEVDAYIVAESKLGLMQNAGTLAGRRVYIKRRFPLECCVLLPSWAAAAFTVLDPLPFIYLEGQEIGSKIYAAGYTALYVPEAAFFHPRDIFDYKQCCYKTALLWRTYCTIVARQYRSSLADYFSIYREEWNIEFNAFAPSVVEEQLRRWGDRSPWALMIVLKGFFDGICGNVQAREQGDGWNPGSFADHWAAVFDSAGPDWRNRGRALFQASDPHAVTWLLLQGKASRLALREAETLDVPPALAHDLISCFAEAARLHCAEWAEPQYRATGYSAISSRDYLRSQLENLDML